MKKYGQSIESLPKGEVMKIVKMKVTTEVTYDDGETKSEILEFDGLESFVNFLNDYSDEAGDSIKQIGEQLGEKAKLISD